jgi:hypothetical protein
MSKPTPRRRARLWRDLWIRKAYEAGVSPAMIARRYQKTRQWVYYRLRIMGCPVSPLRRRRKP